MDKKLNSRFEKTLRRAESILKDREKLSKILSESQNKAQSSTNLTTDFQDDLFGLIRMVKASLQGAYKVPWKALTYALAGILYFLNPMDLLPDFILGIGFFDDIAVLGFVFKTIQSDIQNFLKWEQAEKSSHQNSEK